MGEVKRISFLCLALVSLFLSVSCDGGREKTAPASETPQKLDVTVTSSFQPIDAVETIALAPDRRLPGRGRILLAFKGGDLAAYDLFGGAGLRQPTPAPIHLKREARHDTPPLIRLATVPNFSFEDRIITLILGLEQLGNGRARLWAYGYDHKGAAFMDVPLEATLLKSPPQALCFVAHQGNKTVFSLVWQGRSALGFLEKLDEDKKTSFRFSLKAQNSSEETRQGTCTPEIGVGTHVFQLVPEDEAVLVLKQKKPFARLDFKAGMNSEGLESATVFAVSPDNFGGGFPDGVLAVYDIMTNNVAVIALDYLEGLLVKEDTPDVEKKP